jgi:hypothetical protein
MVSPARCSLRQKRIKETTMQLRKIVLATLAGSTLAASIPAFAHGGDHDDDWREHRGDHGRHFYQPYYPPQAVIVERPPVVVYERPVVVYREPPVVYRQPAVVYESAPVYYAPPAPVYYAPPAPAYYAPPAPAYEPHYANSGAGYVGGAVAGTIIGSRFGRGEGRTAATVIGGVVGALVGNRLATGY